MNHLFILPSRTRQFVAAVSLLVGSGLAATAPAMAQGEAGAAKAEAQRGQLTTPNPNYDQNALLRCDALPAGEKEPCRLRILGAGTTSGSVDGGGLIREVVTQVPDQQPTSGSPAPAPVSSGVK